MGRETMDLLPRWMSERLRKQTRDVVEATYGRGSILLIHLDDPDGPLARGLDELFPPEDHFPVPIDAGGADRLEELASASSRTLRSVKDFGDATLRDMLRAEHLFVLPIQRRASPSGLELSVGRSPTCDVPLPHPSVSKFHAFLGVDAEGGLYLRDAGSDNGTFLDDLKLGDRPTELVAGDELRFGDVVATLSSVLSLRDALEESN